MLLLTVLTVTVLIMGQRLGITIDACLSAAVPYKNDHGKEHQQHGAENKAPHTLKHRQPREGAQTVPHHHKAEEAREQKTDRGLPSRFSLPFYLKEPMKSRKKVNER